MMTDEEMCERIIEQLETNEAFVKSFEEGIRKARERYKKIYEKEENDEQD